MNKTIHSKKYFITGATGGLGLELVKTVLAAGHHVVAAVRKPEALAQLQTQYGEKLTTEKLDVTNLANLAEIAQKHADIDVLVNNAGGAIIGAMEELSDAQVEQQLALNLIAPIHLTRAFLPHLRAKKSGAIVYITSVAGRVGYAGGAMYNAAKFGLEGFAEAIAQEVAHFGIRVAIVEPGSMATNFLANLVWTEESEAYRDSAVGQLRRYVSDYSEGIAGDPIKVAAVIYDISQQPQPPLRTALGIDCFDLIKQGYETNLNNLLAQEELAKSVAFEGKAGFNPMA